jgi:putative phosphoesterase
MRAAVISDVHGNLYALEAVLKDIAGKGINLVYCTGDLVGYGPRPNEVIELVRRHKIHTVMGNYDDAIGNMRLICGCDYKDEKSLRLGEISVAWTKETTTEKNKQWLRELPAEIKLSASGLEILFVHGSPRALNEYLYEDTGEKYLNELLAENNVNVLVCGHTHLPYVKSISKGYVVNAGSAGRPKQGDPDVTYAVIETGWEKGLKAEIVKVPYSYEKTAGEIENAGLPAEFAEVIRTGSQ